MNKITARLVYLPVSILLWTACGTQASQTCDMSKLPIGRESDCEPYLHEDGRLNIAYKKLVASLPQSDVTTLKSAQRRWIKYRDDKCQFDEENAYAVCGPLNPSCENLTLDWCVIQLTSDRANELEKFLASPDEAKLKKFEFTRASRFGDEEYEQHLAKQKNAAAQQQSTETKSKDTKIK